MSAEAITTINAGTKSLRFISHLSFALLKLAFEQAQLSNLTSGAPQSDRPVFFEDAACARDGVLMRGFSQLDGRISSGGRIIGNGQRFRVERPAIVLW